MYNFGGVVVDVDFECLKSINSLLSNVKIFAASQAADVVNIAILGSIPKHNIFKNIIDEIPNSISMHNWRDEPSQVGPHLFTRMAKDSEDLTIFDKDLFYPYLWNEKHRRWEKFPNSYAVHHWDGSWI